MMAEAQSRYRFVIEVVVSGLLLCVGLLWIAPGPLFPLIMDEYGVDRTTVSLTTSFVSLAMGAAAIPAGIIASRIGLRKTFAIGAFLMATSILTPLTSGIVQLIATRVIIAIGIAMAFPIASGIVMQWFSHKELPLINGINMSATSVGNSLVLFVTVIIATALGWQNALMVYGIFTLALALAWLFLGRERKGQAAEAGGTEIVPPVKIGSVLRQKATLLLGLSVTGPFILFMAISSWLPSYYNEAFGMSLAQAGSITALFPLFGIGACLVGGILPLRVGLRKPFLVIPGAVLVFAALGTFMFNNLVIIYISIALFGICELIFMPSVFTIAMELPGSNPRTAALIVSTALALGNVAGFAGPMIVGVLADVTGSYLPGFITTSILSLTLFAGGLMLPETGPKAKRA